LRSVKHYQYCADMTQTLAAAIGRRVKDLRKGQGLSARTLAERMADLGIPWKREVVANLETGRRATVGVDELLALAIVLDVPHTTLLVNPHDSEVMLTPTTPMHPVAALLWLVGEVPFRSRLGPWNLASAPIQLARKFFEHSTIAIRELDMLRMLTTEDEPGSESRRRLRDENVTEYLSRLSRDVHEMRAEGYAVPEVDTRLVDEARQRGVWDQELPTALVADARRGGAWEVDHG